jgi:hypothetical protein
VLTPHLYNGLLNFWEKGLEFSSGCADFSGGGDIFGGDYIFQVYNFSGGL